MYISRLCRYRGAPNGALDSVRFSTTRAATMRKYSPKMSAVPSVPSDPHQPQPQPQPQSSSSPLDQFVFKGDAAMQRIRDIARSLEQISIHSSISSPLTIGQATAGHQETPVLYPDPQVSSSSQRSLVAKSSNKKKHIRRSEKLAPSAASGGVPNATREYLEGSNFVPQFLGTPQNLLVVIDLNGTLLYRPSRTQPKNFITRPHAQLFLKYCIETFTVVIWSSARSENVRSMCDAILPSDLRGKVAAIWGREKFELTQADYNERVQCYKRLQKIWGDPRIATSHPTYDLGGRWDQTNTVLIDDSLEKARSEPHNLIEVPEWFGDMNEADDILPQVHDHLNHLSQHLNVSACLRAHSFKPQTGGLRRPQ